MHDIEQESRILEKLSTVPHPHLTPHLGSWSQEDQCSILMPLAKENLHDFLRGAETPTWDTSFVLWFLSQMTGLTDAVNHIHNLGPAKLGPFDPKAKVNGNRDNTGYHHDLKLTNILVFDHDVLKISDFGTARIQQVSGSTDGKSHQTIHLMGDPDYAVPDYVLTEKASRPHDVWALGCIFLEMLVWACGDADCPQGKRRSAVARFHTHRIYAKETQDRKHKNASFFWYKDGNCALKQTVKDTIKDLEPGLKSTYVFAKLLEVVQSMLCIHVKSDKHPQGRPKITKVRTELEKLLAQARVDLSDDPNCYRFPGGRTSTPTFGDTSTVDGRNDFLHPMSRLSKSRRNSISTFPAWNIHQDPEVAPEPITRPSAPDAAGDTLQTGEQFPTLPPQSLVGDGSLRPAAPIMGSVLDHDTDLHSPIEGLNHVLHSSAH